MFERNCSRYFLQETNDESLPSVRVSGKREDFPGNIETNGLISLIYVERYPPFLPRYFFFLNYTYDSLIRDQSFHLLIPPRLFLF